MRMMREMRVTTRASDSDASGADPETLMRHRPPLVHGPLRDAEPVRYVTRRDDHRVQSRPNSLQVLRHSVDSPFVASRQGVVLFGVLVGRYQSEVETTPGAGAGCDLRLSTRAPVRPGPSPSNLRRPWPGNSRTRPTR